MRRYRRGTLDVHTAQCFARGQPMSCRRRWHAEIAGVYRCCRTALDVPPQRQPDQCCGPSVPECSRTIAPLADAGVRTQSTRPDLGCAELTVSTRPANVARAAWPGEAARPPHANAPAEAGRSDSVNTVIDNFNYLRIVAFACQFIVMLAIMHRSLPSITAHSTTKRVTVEGSIENSP